jgi:hypothetical protein
MVGFVEGRALPAGTLPEVDPDLCSDDLMHSAYYAGGYRALKIVEGDGGARLEEVAAFIGEGGNSSWAVHPMADTRPGHEGRDAGADV